MPFSIKIIDLGANSDNPLTTFTNAELGQIELAANDWATLLSNNDFADLSGATAEVVNGQVSNGQQVSVPKTLGSDDITIFVNKGGQVLVTNPNPPPAPPKIPSLTIVASANAAIISPIQSGIDDGDYLKARTRGIKYQPAAGSITFTTNFPFSTTPPGVGSPDYYLYAVAKHEIAHILGFTNVPRGLPARKDSGENESGNEGKRRRIN